MEVKTKDLITCLSCFRNRPSSRLMTIYFFYPIVVNQRLLILLEPCGVRKRLFKLRGWTYRTKKWHLFCLVLAEESDLVSDSSFLLFFDL